MLNAGNGVAGSIPATGKPQGEMFKMGNFGALTPEMIMTQASTFFGYVAPLLAVAVGIGVAGRVANFFRSLF